MALDWKPTSKWWYGRFTIRRGKTKLINLGVEIAGRRPQSITEPGDGAFERSRGKALQEHERVLQDIHGKRNLEELTQRVIELKIGRRVESVTLVGLAEAWTRIPRARETVARYSSVMRARLERFVQFLRERFPSVEDLDMVTREHARAFMDAEEARGISPKTWNDTLKTLRTTFRHLAADSDAYRSYLATCPARRSETIFRQPFTPDDLRAILDAARDDEFARPLILTAMCTAMRRGDCCLLKWREVDLKNNFLTVKTTKTGQTVTIPIFPALSQELRRRQRSDEFVFPEQAAMYRENPDGITLRIRNVLLKAGFVDGETLDRARGASAWPVLAEDELRARVQTALQGTAIDQAKRGRMQQVFERYQSGRTVPQIVIETGFSKGSVSTYLNELERRTEAAVVRRGAAVELPAKIRGELHADRANGQRRASIRDFHSFRVTWVTLALTAGVPLELVQKVTGHKTVEVVLKHYFQPGREDFRRTLQAAMPQLLMGGEKSRDDQLREIIDRMTPKTFTRDKALAQALLAGPACKDSL